MTLSPVDPPAADERAFLVAEPAVRLPPASHWLRVGCLIGVDYFSTLAYQVSITFLAAGWLGPMATLVVVAMTLCGALPVYLYLAGRSPHGQSSIGLLEQFVRGWKGKTLVLVVLGFAATDFVITKTLSTAAAAQHVIHSENPAWQQMLDDGVVAVRDWIAGVWGPAAAHFFNRQLLITLLLGIMSFTFWAMIRRGFNRKATAYAVLVVVVYLVVNAIVVTSGIRYLAAHPELVREWYERLLAGDWRLAHPPVAGSGLWALVASCLLLFPQICLGLSGLEMSIVAMPEVRGDAGDASDNPRGRIRNTRRVMVFAALAMCVLLAGSVTVGTLLIPVGEFGPDGHATNRALAYLAHGNPLADGQPATAMNAWFGERFGTLYDVSTVLILCLAGTSVITGLTTLLPQFLLKFGMQLRWVHAWGVLFVLFAATNLAVTLIFHANVDDQRGAYATGVLVLITTAATLAAIDRYRRRQGRWFLRLPWVFATIAALFLVTTLDVVIEHPSGMAIAGTFIVVIVGMSIVSRALRSNELRTLSLEFDDEASRGMWEYLRRLELPVLVPHRPGRDERLAKAAALRHEHQLSDDVDLVFVEIQVDDPSDFYQRLRMNICREDHVFVIRLSGCVSVPHALAAVALELSVGQTRPPALHFGWSEMNLLEQAWSFLVFGEGNVPMKVHELLRRAQPDPAKRPRVVVG